MNTYREAIYLCLDFIKAISDDAIISPEHVAYLIDKHRAFLLKQAYDKDPKKQLSQSNYQTIMLDLVEVPAFPHGDSCFGTYLKSTIKVPQMLQIGTPKAFTVNYINNSMICLVSPERLEFTGYNKYLKNFIYAAISTDGYLYLKSSNPQYSYLKRVGISGIFENPSEISELIDGCPCEHCDYLDENIPIEEAFMYPLLEAVIREIKTALYAGKDDANNANDDLADIAAFVRQNMKDRYVKDTQ